MTDELDFFDDVDRYIQAHDDIFDNDLEKQLKSRYVWAVENEKQRRLEKELDKNKSTLCAVYTSKGHIYSTNLFVNMSVVHNLDDVLALRDYDFICTNDYLSDIGEFTSDLFDFIDTVATKAKGKNTRYGVIFTVLLDNKKRKAEEVKLLAEKFASKEFNGLPYYAFSKLKGNAQYLVMYVCDRQHFKDAKYQVYTKDTYLDKNGKLCSKNNKDARKICKGTEKLNSPKVHFSAKVDLFRFASEKQFEYYIKDIKKSLLTIFDEVLNVKAAEKHTLPKFSIPNASKLQSRNVRAWNQGIRMMENLIDEAHKAAIDLKSNEAISKVLSLHQTFYRMLKKREVIFYSDEVTKKKKFKCDIDLNSTNILRTRENIDTMIRRCHFKSYVVIAQALGYKNKYEIQRLYNSKKLGDIPYLDFEVKYPTSSQEPIEITEIC